MTVVDLRDLLSGKGVTDHEGVIADPESEEDMEVSGKRKNPATKKKKIPKGKGKKSKDVQKDIPSPTEFNLRDISMSDIGSSGHKPRSYIYLQPVH